MTWSGAGRDGKRTGGARRGTGQAGLRLRVLTRRGLRRGRRAAAVVTVQSLLASCLGPVTAVVAVTAAVTAASAVTAAVPAKAASGSVLILATSVNGGTASAEYQAATALGYTATVEPAATWDTLTTADFQSYNAIIIGDPSTTTCSSTVPSDALSTAATWGAAVTGNVAVLGTAPALGGGNKLIKDAISYAASGSATGLYVSLNCEYAVAAADTDVTLLDQVEGGGFTVTGQGGNCPSAAGTVNTWEALALTPFNGLTSGDVGPWASPACSVQETLNSWPAGLAGVAYYTGATPATFTASDGATGQAYVVAGVPVPVATAHLAMSINGQVPAGTTAGGGSNPAAPGVSQPLVGGVNTENGDFTQSATDLSVPTFGPALDFSRTYDAQAAQQQTQTAAPGPMGYGWSDNWASSLATASPVPADIYLMDGRRTDNGDGGPPGSAVLDSPGTVFVAPSGDVYIADTAGNRIQEIPATTGTQWGMAVTAGDEYTVVGNSAGLAGQGADGNGARAGRLRSPESVTVDSAGNMYIADTGNARVVEIPVASGTQWGISMTANDYYTVAGYTGQQALGGDNKPATQSHLDNPAAVAMGAGSSGDLYIADSGNNRIQEVAATTKTQWGQSMTADYVYTVAGSSAGTGGFSGTGGAATSALLSMPEGVAVSAAGNLYIADTANCRVAEVPPASGTQRGVSMTANDIYTVAGRGGSSNCTNGNDNKAATSSNLNAPAQVETGAGSSEDLYIADTGSNKIQEVAATSKTQWGQSMTANYVYTVAGSPSGAAGYSGDGGASDSALMRVPQSASVSTTTLYTTDTGNDRVRQVNSAGTISAYAGNGYTLAQTGNGGPAIEAGLSTPEGEVFDPAGDVFVADSANNRIQEIAAATHTQYGISMTAGDVYTIAGHATGASGSSGDGGPATSAYLNSPEAIAMDASGNIYIADTNNCRIQKVTTGGTISTVAGSSAGTCGLGGDGVAATSSDLNGPEGVGLDTHGDIYIADTLSNRIQEVFASGGQAFGQTMTAGDVYTIAGSSAGTAGHSGNGGKATSALLYYPVNMGIDGKGNLYIADWNNNRIQEVPVTTGTQRGQSMTKYYMYTVAGSASGTAGLGGDGIKATSSDLHNPGNATVDPAGNIYISDGANNRFQEVAVSNGTQWGQSMTANDVYTVAGDAGGTSGNSGDGGPATAALMHTAENIALDPAGDLYVTDFHNDHLREVTSATAPTITPAPGYTSALYPAPGGITVTQPSGAPVTFYAQTSGCTSPYVLAGQYCALPQNMGASLTYDSAHGIYTFTPQPGEADTYNTGGNLTSISDVSTTGVAFNTLNVAYGTPAPGSGNCPASASWCQLITAANGRTLTIGYNSSNLVTSVTDPLGRQWSYGYTGNDLTSVIDPIGNSSPNPAAHTTSYTYDGGASGYPLNASNIVTITKPNGQTGGPNAGAHTTITYDSAGRVTSQTNPMGFTTSYDYSQFNPSTGNGTITVTDPDGNNTVYDYTQGTLAAQSAWTESTALTLTLTSEQDYLPDQAITNGDNSAGTQLVTTTADGNGNITTYTYDSAGNTVSTTSPDGQTAPGGGAELGTVTQSSTSLDSPDCSSQVDASATCQQDPAPATVPHGQVISPPASVPAAGEGWTLYDDLGNDLYTTVGVYEPGSSTAAYAQTSYQLFNGNSVTLPGTSTAITCQATAPAPSLPCATINAAGVVTQLAYDSAGDLVSTSTPDGNGSEVATTYAYNGDGEQISTTPPDGNLAGANAGNYTTTTAFNADGQQTSQTQAGGSGATATPRSTSYGYDANGNQTSVIDARGNTTATTYNADDQATLVTDPDNHATLSCYDGDGDVAQTVLPSGVALGSLTPASCPTSYPAGYGNRLSAYSTTYTYDANGRQTVMTTPAPAGQSGYVTTAYGYDNSGNLTQITAPPTSNASGAPDQVTHNTYNTADLLTSTTTSYGTAGAATVSYCYDPNGDRTSVVYADGNVSGVAPCNTNSAYQWIVDPTAYPTQAAFQTAYSYDTAQELVSVTRPATAVATSGGTTTYTYSPIGDLLTSTTPDGITATMTYTPTGQEASVSYSGGSAHSVSYTYDASGNQASMTDATGASQYTYDSFDELTSTTNGAGQTTGYAYDGNGEVTGITYPLPAAATWAATDTAQFSYSKSGALASFTDFNGNTSTFSANGQNLPVSQTLGATGDTVATAYANDMSMSSITLANGANTLQSFTYADAPSGDILSETDTPSSAQSPAVYTYDARGRVTSMTSGTGAARNYSFDATGGLTTLPSGATGIYDNAGELTSSTLSGVTTNYSYDAAGQLLAAKQGSTTTASGTWNGAGQLTAYTNAAGSMTAASYDGTGHRASSTITPGGGTAVTQDYVWDGDHLLMDGRNAYIYGYGNAPAEQVNLATGTITYLSADSLGSVRGTVDSTGALTATTSYDAWGNPQTTGGLTATTPFGYASGYTDPTGLVYLINRYYDPTTGQFTSLDPQIDRTTQPYAYTSGNPVSETDSSGLSSVPISGPPWATGGCAHAIPSCRYYNALYATDYVINDIVHEKGFKKMQADVRSGGLDFVAAAVAFGLEMCAGCNWDMKRILTPILGSFEHGEIRRYTRITAGKQITYNVWGNILFGYIGRRAGFSSHFLEEGATGKLTFGWGVGAQTAGNYIERQMGYDMYHRVGIHYTNLAIEIAIWGRFNSLSHYCDVLPFPSKNGSCGGRPW